MFLPLYTTICKGVPLWSYIITRRQAGNCNFLKNMSKRLDIIPQIEYNKRI